MQTRKRAKSVMFGKKHKEKEEKPKAEEEVVAAEIAKETPAKEERVALEEKKVTQEKEPHFELSETLPKNEPEEEKEDPKKEEKEEKKSEVETPASEFVSDGTLSATPELPKNSKEEAAATPEEHAVASVEPSELSQPVEPAATTPAATEPAGQQAEDAETGLPPSAFTIQSNEALGSNVTSPAPVAEGDKKRFGLYFFVVAFIAFILGLGAMAAASYFGVFGVNMAKLPAGVHVPGILGQKPTLTSLPPTVKPTEKPVDLTAFTISVLNGSGISGKAADEKTALTGAGFKVTSTGNANTSDFTQTKIAAKKSVDSQFLSKLEDELKRSYEVDTSVTLLPDSATTDVVVTLGKSVAE